MSAVSVSRERSGLRRHVVTMPIAVILACAALCGSAVAAEDVILRTSVVPEEPWVGQRTRLIIEVLGADGWAQIRDMGEIEISGAYVLRTESQGTRLSETSAGTTYSGQRYQLSIYCQRPGRVEIPAMPVTAVVRQWGVNAAETPHHMTTPSTSLICKVPPGAEAIQGLISTNRLEARQNWSSRPDSAATGDAISRTVTLSADDVSGMAFPPMRHPEIEGVAIYPGQPSVDDTTDRGALEGERVEKVTYVLEQPGEVALPAIVLSWWDIDDGVLRKIELPGLEFTVEGEIEPEPVAEPEIVAADPPRLAPLAALAAMLVAFGLWIGLRLGRWFLEWRRARLESEETAFRRVMSALRSGDPGTISAAVMHWLDRLDPGTRPARLDLFLVDHGDERSRCAAAVLARRLADHEPFDEARTLARGLKRARQHFRQTRRRHQRAAGVLPELNGP